MVVSDGTSQDECIGWRHLIDNTSEQQCDFPASTVHAIDVIVSLCVTQTIRSSDLVTSCRHFMRLGAQISHSADHHITSHHHTGSRQLSSLVLKLGSTPPRAVTERAVSQCPSPFLHVPLDIYRSGALMSISVNHPAWAVLLGYTMRYVASRLACVPCSSWPILA